MTEGALDALMLTSMERLLSQVNTAQERRCIQCDKPTEHLFISQSTDHEAAREIKFMWRCDHCGQEVAVANFKFDKWTPVDVHWPGNISFVLGLVRRQSRQIGKVE
jgi:hypothetical protein